MRASLSTHLGMAEYWRHDSSPDQFCYASAWWDVFNTLSLRINDLVWSLQLRPLVLRSHVFRHQVYFTKSALSIIIVIFSFLFIFFPQWKYSSVHCFLSFFSKLWAIWLKFHSWLVCVFYSTILTHIGTSVLICYFFSVKYKVQTCRRFDSISSSEIVFGSFKNLNVCHKIVEGINKYRNTFSIT